MRLSNDKLKKMGWISVNDVPPVIGKQYNVQNLKGDVLPFIKENGGWRFEDGGWLWDADVQYYSNI